MTCTFTAKVVTIKPAKKAGLGTSYNTNQLLIDSKSPIKVLNKGKTLHQFLSVRLIATGSRLSTRVGHAAVVP